MVRKPLLLILCLPLFAWADTGYKDTVQVTEVDGSPKCMAGQIKVTNGTLTCNGQTATITTGGSGGGGSSSSLAVGTGTTAGYSGTIVSSPTALLLGNNAQFTVTLQGGATAFLTILTSSITAQGNVFNGASQLVQLNGSTQYPALSGALVTNLTGANVTGVVPSSVLPSSVVYTSQSSSVTILNNFGVAGQVNLPMTHSSSVTFQGVIGVPSNVNTQLTIGSSATVLGNLGVQGQVNQPMTHSSSVTFQGVVGIPSNVNTQLTVGSSETVQGNFGVQGQLNQALTVTSSITVTGGNAVQIASNTILSGTTFYQGGNVVIGALTASRCTRTDANNNLASAAADCGSGSSNLPASIAYTTSTVAFTQPQTIASSLTVNGNLGVLGQVNQSLTVASSITVTGGNVVQMSSNVILPGTTFYQSGSITNSGGPDTFGTQSATFTIIGNLSTLGGMYFSSQTSNGTAGKITANYTTGATDNVIFASAPASNLTVTLNHSTNSIIGGSGQVIQITKVNASTYTVTIKVSGSDLIVGTTGLLTLNSIGQTDELVSDGAGNWWPHGQGIQITPFALRGNPDAVNGTFTNTVSSDITVCPFTTTVPTTVTGWRVNTQTLAGGRYAYGIYDTAGNVLVSTGPVVMAGLNLQTLAMNPYNLPPGQYYMAIQFNNIATQIDGASLTGVGNLCSRIAETAMGIVNATIPGATTSKLPHFYALIAGGRQS